MREIKFRGKRLDNGEWIVGSYIEAENRDRSIAHQIVPYKSGEVVREVDPATVGQYTGLQDKNGEEIYEGDIVCGSPQRVVGEVVYHNDRIEIKDDDPQYWVGVNFFSQEGREIIGNIHDNTELLKTE